jgi:putative AlgH/UPF0301 family transcriptional regulator
MPAMAGWNEGEEKMSTNPETAAESLKGHLLVASPYADGTPYRRAAVLLLEHSEQGAAGVVVDGTFRASMDRLRAEAMQAIDVAVPRIAALAGVPVRVATWRPGQLDAELQNGLWLHTQASAALVFSERVPEWRELVRHVGRTVYRDALGIAEFPVNPSLN